MKRNLVVVMGALAVTATMAQAQGKVSDPQCADAAAGHAAVQNTCNTAVDLFNYMAPQLGTVIAGGNATLGQGGSLGGPGHFAVSVRGNVLKGSLPQIDKYSPSVTTRQAETIATKDQILGLPAVDVAFGLFAGLPLGVTKVGGVDVLLSANYIPAYSGAGVSVKVPSGSLKIGYGARVGLLEESLIVPGVGFSYMKRDLPTVSLTANSGVGGTNRLDVTNLRVNTTSWRLTASKSLIMFGLAAGVGQDKLSSSAAIQATVAGVSSATFKGSQDLTRTTYFGDLSFNVLLAKFVLEVGSTSGGSVPTYNTFSGTEADASRLFASAGLRIGF
jgi:hypothetical protein